jgi:hypothetical protein
MEEATELFVLMQGMLRVSEQARLLAQRTMPPPSTSGPTPAVPAPLAPAGSAAADDLFLVGILAMGAGAGLLAAMAKRLQDTAPPPADDRPDRASKGATSR